MTIYFLTNHEPFYTQKHDFNSSGGHILDNKVIIIAIAVIAIVIIAVAAVGLSSPSVPSDSVRYDGNGGTYDGKTTIDLKTTEVLPFYFEKNGFHMVSWNTKADGGGTEYQVGGTVSLGTVLYAQWSDANTLSALNLYTSEFNLYVGQKGSSDVSILDNRTVALPTKDAVIVVSSPNAGDKLSVDDNNNVIIDKGTTKKKLTLSFDGTGLSLGDGKILNETGNAVYYELVQDAKNGSYNVSMNYGTLLT